MSIRSAEDEIRRLVELITRYDHDYYRLGRPRVPDAEYDRLYHKLEELEKRYPELKPADSPTQRVGSDLSQEFPEVAHSIPVLSLDKCYSAEELLKWAVKVRSSLQRSVSFLLEEKIDGASIILYYRAGELARAVTRGNGLVGNDITGNVRTIRAVPLRLAEAVTVAVRGEIFLPKHLFRRINANQESPYANPRNLAAGTLRRIKSAEVARVPLDIFVYEGFFDVFFSNHLDILEKLEMLGFQLNPNMGFFGGSRERERVRERHPGWFVASLEDMGRFIEQEQAKRRELPYDIDGLVLKVNQIEARDELGYTGHHPRWSMALKFEAPVGRTAVRDIEVQVGRTGRVTPVARVEPVAIAGTTVSNATLHNQDYVDLLELAIGDTVEVSKRGDIIPAVERVLEKNEAGNTTWQIPQECPSCGQELKVQGAHHFCTNPECPAQIRGRLRFFVGRNQMDIENLGPETVDFLLDKSYIGDVQDIYRFDPSVLEKEPGFGPKKVELIEQGIAKSLRQPYQKVLVSLGIADLGPKAVELLVDAGFRDVDSLLAAADRKDVPRLSSIHGMGEKTAGRIIEQLNLPEVRTRIAALRAAGLSFAAEAETGSEPQIFQNQIWCVTGSFESFQPRERAMEEVKKRGGKTVSSVSAQTTHLLAGRSPGSKLQKALSLNVKIVGEEEFLRLIGRGSA